MSPLLPPDIGPTKSHEPSESPRPIALSGNSELSELYFHDLPNKEREELLDSVYDPISHVLEGPRPFSMFTLQLMGIRMGMMIGLPLLLSVILLGLAHSTKPIPLVDSRNAAQQTENGAPSQMERPPRGRTLSDTEYDVLRRQEMLYTARRQFQKTIMFIAFGLVSIVFIFGHVLLARAQQSLKSAWCQVEEDNYDYGRREGTT